jgi:integral membrane protein (TIGR01906 family)
VAPGATTAEAPGGRRSGWVASAVVFLATIIVLIGIALLPFLNPVWVGFGQERAEADAWTGWPMTTVHEVTNAVLADLIVGPPDFDQKVDGEPVFNDREVGHLQDVRTVLIWFAVAVAASVGAIVVAWRVAGRAAVWRGVRVGAITLVAGVVALGILAAVAFETLFEIFHRIFFASGTYTFDPDTERLVQLFPMSFWFETSIALGVVLVVLGVITLVLAERRRRAPGAPVAGPTDGEPGR